MTSDERVAHPPPLHYRVLGPFTIETDDGPLAVPTGKPRHLLLLLLANRMRPVGVDFLIDCLWDHDPPQSARENLRAYIHRLRRLLGPVDRIRTADGYQLVLDAQAPPDTLDSHLFEAQIESGQQLLTDGEHRAALRCFREALDLWSFERECYPDASGPGLDDERRRLDDLHIRAVLGYCAALEHTGDLAEAVETVGAAHLRAPLNERLGEYLMRGLADTGRREDALAVFQSLRRHLSAELGLSPGRGLVELHHDLLTDTTPTSSRPHVRRTPCLLPPDQPGFSGREEQLSWLLSQIKAGSHESALSERGLPLGNRDAYSHVCAVYGQGGVGKTALTVRAAHLLRSSFPDGQLFINARAIEENAIQAHAILDMFLRVLGFSEREIPEETQARSAIFRSFVTQRRVLIVLDNVSDETDLAALLPPAGSSAVLLTSRVPLSLIPSASQCKLYRPDPDQAVEMLRFYAGARGRETSSDSLASVVESCGLLPLAIRIAGAQLSMRPHLTVDALRDRLSDRSRALSVLSFGSMDVSSAIDLSLRPLGDAARRLFQLAGTLGTPTFTVELAAALLDQACSAAEEAIDELVDAQLLDAMPYVERTCYQFHDLVKLRARAHAQVSLPESERLAAVERAIGWMIVRAELAQTQLVGEDHLSVHSGALRWQPERAGPARPLQPTEWAEQELDIAIALIDQAASLGLAAASWDLAVTMAPLLEVTRNFDEWSRSHESALRAAQSAGDRRGEAALLAELGEMLLERQQYAEAKEVLHLAGEAFESGQEPLGRALVDEKLGRIAMAGSHLDEAERRFDRAAVALRGMSRPGNLALVLRCLGQVDLARSEYAEAEAHLSEAAALARTSGAWRLGGQIRYRQGELYLSTDRLASAEEAFTDVLELFGTRTEPLGRAYALHGLGRARAGAGDRRGAESHLRQALRISIELEERDLEQRIRATLVGVLGPDRTLTC